MAVVPHIIKKNCLFRCTQSRFYYLHLLENYIVMMTSQVNEPDGYLTRIITLTLIIHRCEGRSGFLSSVQIVTFSTT